ncbi:Quinone oxidoreductase protein, partial [Globisporangium splendens]
MTSIPATFRAYRFEKYGAPDQVLELRSDVPQAPLAHTEVRVKVRSAAINPADYMLTTGDARSLMNEHPSSDKPFGIGFDGAGTVVEVGSAVHMDGDRALHVGDDVYFMTSFASFGSFAEYLTVDQSFVARKPTTLSFDQAASVPLVALTSYQALLEHAKLQKGERVLILGGSSATGIYAIQIAKVIGAHVVTTASARNAAFVKSLGADQVIEYTSTNWVDALPPHSIDVFYDCGIEPNAWNADAQTVLRKDTGRFVTLLGITDPKAASKHGAKLVGSIVVYPSAAHLTEVTKLIEDGKIVTPIDSVHRFENVLDAVARISSRRATGKVVIQVTPDA